MLGFDSKESRMHADFFASTNHFDTLGKIIVAAGLGERRMSPKVTRNSVECWITSAENPLNIVCLQQGHDPLAPMMHYHGLAFTEL